MIGTRPGAGDKPVEMLVLLPLGSWRGPQAVVHTELLWKGNAAGC